MVSPRIKKCNTKTSSIFIQELAPWEIIRELLIITIQKYPGIISFRLLNGTGKERGMEKKKERSIFILLVHPPEMPKSAVGRPSQSQEVFHMGIRNPNTKKCCCCLAEVQKQEVSRTGTSTPMWDVVFPSHGLTYWAITLIPKFNQGYENPPQ